MSNVDYTAMRLDIMNKGVIYIPPRRINAITDEHAAGVKFYTLHDGYGWAWQTDGMIDAQKEKQMAIARRMYRRLCGGFGWFWARWFRALYRFERFTWWLFRGR